jgi:hypothetical protein
MLTSEELASSKDRQKWKAQQGSPVRRGPLKSEDKQEYGVLEANERSRGTGSTDAVV